MPCIPSVPPTPCARRAPPADAGGGELRRCRNGTGGLPAGSQQGFREPQEKDLVLPPLPSSAGSSEPGGLQGRGVQQGFTADLGCGSTMLGILLKKEKKNTKPLL